MPLTWYTHTEAFREALHEVMLLLLVGELGLLSRRLMDCVIWV